MKQKWPAPNRADHQRFCEHEGWRAVRDARGRNGAHHITFELDLPDGRTLRTRVSHPPDRTTYGPALWAHILRDQLDVSEQEFWASVKDGEQPDRGAPAVPAPALPAEIVHLLLTRVGLTEAEIGVMSKDDAVRRLAEFWSGKG